VKLQTIIPVHLNEDNQIDYGSKILLFGSCFAEHLSKKFDYFKFKNSQNPFGIYFHPIAIESLIKNAINNKIYTDKDIFFHNEQWHCFESHSKLSSYCKEELLLNLNTHIKSTYEQLCKSTHIIITLGTAWTYRHLEKNIVVSNCHKLPQKLFLKGILPIDEIYRSIQSIVHLIKSVNLDATVIFTVSPVRHLKDGFIENTRSKAHLIAAVHSLLTKNNNAQKIHYFPSYEIMIDELRDYRFYTDDMIHPNALAVRYIWSKFQECWIASYALKTMKEVENIQRDLNHKPFNLNSKAHQQFIKQVKLRQEKLQFNFPNIVF
jgi:lysophospholipase L1-like esterase